MIGREKGQMVFLKFEVRPRPYWIVESGVSDGWNAQDTFWVIDAEGNSKSVDEEDLTEKPPVAIFGE